MKRRDDWHIRLHEEIERQRREPFAWGERDCALFAADCICAMTDVDPAEGFRGRYNTAQGARLALKRAKHKDLATLAASVCAPIPVALASVGDVASWTDNGNVVLGVIIGERVMARMVDGLGTVDRGRVERAFKVP